LTTKNTVVVEASDSRTGPIVTVASIAPSTVPAGYLRLVKPPVAELVVALVVEIELPIATTVVLAAGRKLFHTDTSQSPAVSEILVMFVSVLVVREIADPKSTAEEMISPTFPAAALSLVAVPVHVPVRVVAVEAVLAVIEVLHPNPVFVVQIRALPGVLHVPTANAVGTAVPDVALPSTVLVA
jgi:hypothetical protein